MSSRDTYVVGIDVGGTDTKAALVAAAGTVLDDDLRVVAVMARGDWT